MSAPTSWWAPRPRRCADCGVYEPIARLRRRADRDHAPCIFVDLISHSHDNAVCSDRDECARRLHHRVGGPR